MMQLPPPSPLSDDDLPSLAMDWRRGFFQAITSSFQKGEESPDIDLVHAQVLDELLVDRGIASDIWTAEHRKVLVQSWHKQLAWRDSLDGLRRLKRKFPVVVLANGTTRLQLDIVRSSGLQFDALFSSQLLQTTKPNPDMYHKCLNLLDLEPHQTAMVAAHAYDLRAAAKLGMKTIYIRRVTEDPDEDMAKVKSDVDLFIADADERRGLSKLADLWGA